ncbi:hypothetical protein FM109_02875 [Vibrio casei]|nr:hypothetical protein FM109_02875 [Vibrio casei]
MSSTTIIQEPSSITINKKLKSTLTTAMHFTLLYGTAFAFIGLTAFTWINF